MSAFRAIEQGHSIIRSTRFGLSAIISPYGEMISQSSSFDKNDKIMISNVQAKRIYTIHSTIGDLFIYLCLGFFIVFMIDVMIRKPAGKKV